MGCCTTTPLEEVFDDNMAAYEVRRYRRKGPRRSTRLLLAALKAEGVEGKTLLDVGGGVGAIQHELLNAGASAATSVEASQPYLNAARVESTRRGHAGRARFRHGDFVELAATIEAADVVTLDRVVCCYPDAERLIRTSAARARILYGLVYPRDTRLVRIGFAVANLVLRLLRKQMRAFVHRAADLERSVEDCGLAPRYAARAGAWQVAVYRRA